ncbi:MAG: DUF167 domain-containing protein [Promethearchaeota archaeon]
MKSLERISDFEYIIRLKIKPNSKFQSVINDNGNLKVSLKSKPVRNKANIELINLIRKNLHVSLNQVEIVSGLKSEYKMIKINFFEKLEEQELLNRLLN